MAESKPAHKPDRTDDLNKKPSNTAKAPESRIGIAEALARAKIQKPDGLLGGEWLRTMSEQELVLTLIAMTLELQSRVGASTPPDQMPSTDTIAVDVDLSQFSPLPDKSDLKMDDDSFLRLPADSAGVQPESNVWRFILLSSNPRHKLLVLAIHDEIVIGRNAEEGEQPDLDLARWDAEALGISRRHARLRPTPTGLQLIDHESTNGTFANQQRLQPGKPRTLRDEDVVSFGNLHFKYLLVNAARSSKPFH